MCSVPWKGPFDQRTLCPQAIGRLLARWVSTRSRAVRWVRDSSLRTLRCCRKIRIRRATASATTLSCARCFELVVPTGAKRPRDLFHSPSRDTRSRYHLLSNENSRIVPIEPHALNGTDPRRTHDDETRSRWIEGWCAMLRHRRDAHREVRNGARHPHEQDRSRHDYDRAEEWRSGQDTREECRSDSVARRRRAAMSSALPHRCKNDCGAATITVVGTFSRD